MGDEPWIMSGSLSRVIKTQFSRKNKDLYAVLYKGFGSNVARLEFYENEKAVSSGIYIFMLVCSDLMKINKISGSSKEDKHSFVLATKDQQYVFYHKNAHDCDRWVKAIKEIMQWLQSSATPPPTKAALAGAVTSQRSSTVTVTNDIYDAFTEVCSDYQVTVGKDTRQKLPVDGPVRLVVEDRHITVIGPGGNRLIRWNIKNLRRIGYSDHDFHVEAGRRCESGVGYYSFDTNMGRQVYIKVEEEKLLYSNPAAKEGKETLPVGMVPSVVRSDSPPLAIGGHIYEEMDDLFKQGVEILVDTQSPKSKMPPTALRGRKQSAENGSDSVTPIQGFPAKAPTPNTDAGVYSEVKQYKEAWREHGIGDEENPGGHYENVDSYRPTEEEVKDTYDSLQSKSVVRKRDKSPIYAKVNKTKPKKK